MRLNGIPFFSENLGKFRNKVNVKVLRILFKS